VLQRKCIEKLREVEKLMWKCDDDDQDIERILLLLYTLELEVLP
jgi:hypothetical protein